MVTSYEVFFPITTQAYGGTMINCMMLQNVSLTDDMRTVLFRSAIEMCRAEERRLDFVNEEFMGRVETSFDKTLLGVIYGILFSAHIETELGSGEVTFIVREGDLDVDFDDLMWISVPMTWMFPGDGNEGSDLPN